MGRNVHLLVTHPLEGRGIGSKLRPPGLRRERGSTIWTVERDLRTWVQCDQAQDMEEVVSGSVLKGNTILSKSNKIRVGIYQKGVVYATLKYRFSVPSYTKHNKVQLNTSRTSNHIRIQLCSPSFLDFFLRVGSTGYCSFIWRTRSSKPVRTFQFRFAEVS